MAEEDPLEGLELDPVTEKAVSLLAAIDVLGARPTSRRSWKDPIVISIMVLALAVAGSGITIQTLISQNHSTSKTRTDQIAKLITQGHNQGERIRQLVHKNDVLEEFIRDLGFKPPVKNGHHKTTVIISPPSGGTTTRPSSHPSTHPSSHPSNHPSSHPSTHPSSHPSSHPSKPPKSPKPTPKPKHTKLCVIQGLCVTLPPLGTNAATYAVEWVPTGMNSELLPTTYALCCAVFGEVLRTTLWTD